MSTLYGSIEAVDGECVLDNRMKDSADCIVRPHPLRSLPIIVRSSVCFVSMCPVDNRQCWSLSFLFVRVMINFIFDTHFNQTSGH